MNIIIERKGGFARTSGSTLDPPLLIVDLSSPRHSSVNDGIDSSLCSLRYSGLDEAVAIIKRLGRGCLIAKPDLQSAYRVIPVHPDDRELLAVTWRSNIFLDAALPFGLRSAPKIFSAVADAMLFVMFQNGVGEAIHYLDDFLFAMALQTRLSAQRPCLLPSAPAQS